MNKSIIFRVIVKYIVIISVYFLYTVLIVQDSKEVKHIIHYQGSSYHCVEKICRVVNSKENMGNVASKWNKWLNVKPSLNSSHKKPNTLNVSLEDLSVI